MKDSMQRAKGSGTIRERSPGRWEIRFDLPPDGTGKRRRETETVRGNRKLAESVLRKREQEIKNGDYVVRNRETVAQFMESWLNGYASTHTSPRTFMGYQGNVNRYIVPCLGGVLVQSLTARHVQALHTWMLEKGLSNQTIVHAHRVLSEALKHAVDWGILPKNPAQLVPPPPPEQKDLEMWNIETVGRFLEAAKDSPFFDVFKLALYTGMRRSELTGLRWEGIDFSTNTLRVTGTLQRVTGKGLINGQPKTKTGRRAIDLGGPVVDLLHSIRGKQLALQAELGNLYGNDKGYVFTDQLGNPVDSNRLSREFGRIVKEAGLPHATLHALRHFHASLLLAEGIDIKETSQRLGHSKASFTLDVYSHLMPGRQRRAVQALDKRLSELFSVLGPDSN